jgi:hypothetical protein
MRSLTKLIAHILAAGGPNAQLARVRWPMHRALVESAAESSRHGHPDLWQALAFKSSSKVGTAVIGADAAFDELLALGVLNRDGQGRHALAILDEQSAVVLRRDLMLMTPQHVQAFQRTGERWAALASTALKNRSIAPRSSAATVSSSIPKRANLSLPGSA